MNFLSVTVTGANSQRFHNFGVRVRKGGLSDKADTELDPEAHKQNHRTVEIGKDLWTLSGPTTMLKQGHLEPTAQDCIQAAFQYLQGWRLHKLSGQLMPVLGHSHNKEVFPKVQREPPVFQFVPIDSGTVASNHCKKSSSLIFISSHEVFIHIEKVSLRLFFSRLNSPSSLRPSSYKRWSKP